MPVSLPTSVLAAIRLGRVRFVRRHRRPVIAWVGLLAHDRRDAGRRPRARTAATRSRRRGARWSSHSCGSSFGLDVRASSSAPCGAAPRSGEYLAGYLIEKSLSVDNVFVWAVIFSTFAIPLRYQHRVLFWGVFGALVLRAIFITAGVALSRGSGGCSLVFGVFLVYTGVKVLRHRAGRRHARA